MPRPRPTRDPEIVYTGLKDIHLQKWIALRMNGTAPWSDWSRADPPGLVSGPNLWIRRIPDRFSDQDREQSLNYTNLEKAFSRQGGGSIRRRPFGGICIRRLTGRLVAKRPFSKEAPGAAGKPGLPRRRPGAGSASSVPAPLRLP